MAENLPSSSRDADFRRFKTYAAITFLVAAPVLIALPPRKLDHLTVLLGTAFCVSANHLTRERTGRSILDRIESRVAAHSTHSPIPGFTIADLPSERAQEIQAKLRATRDAQIRDGSVVGEEWERLKARQLQDQGVVERVWMGGETAGWKERRLREEQRALDEGKGLHAASVPSFDWSRVNPSQDLEYHDCYEGFQCTRLLVPLDWQNASSARIAIAVIRLPATVAADDPSHGGSLMLNPGGPGGSGVDFALRVGRTVQRNLEGERHYEILSFDPRGVRLSEPHLDCFASSAEQSIWGLGQRIAGGIGVDGGSARFLSYHWAGAEALVKLCEGKGSSAKARQYVSTTYAARDMLHLVDKIDEEKEKEKEKKKKKVGQGFDGADVNAQAPLRETRAPDESKLQYLGASYGTYLGQVFASMYPHRVGRMMLDSVVDGNDWRDSLFYSSLNDTDNALQSFYRNCYTKQSACSLWQPEDTSPLNITARVNSLLEELDIRPARSIGAGTASLITGDDIRAQIFNSLYSPLTRGASSISCPDGPALLGKPLSEFEDYFTSLNAQSVFGAPWSLFKLTCWQWPWRSPWRFEGAWNASLPILFVGNRFDPVTPFGNARTVAERYEGSAVLMHESVGHGGLFPGSRCMWEYARAYLGHGALPIAGTICPADCEPFDGGCSSDSRALYL
ncbi:hypothetical protein AOCH_003187 [Aspergillus ochraceoroseus]|uniref:Uncharacterized protein n=1 Tax=Aspergillus ochraceoroseus TaxID=138278 RepID=A0A0F8UJM8_9EURO|nr:hypothetical protein AOCH_003187 [Aspergillus ochraceoroseus]